MRPMGMINTLKSFIFYRFTVWIIFVFAIATKM